MTYARQNSESAALATVRTFDATVVEPNPEPVSVASGRPRTAFAHDLVLQTGPRPLHVENPAVLQLPGPAFLRLIYDSIRRGHRHGEVVASMVNLERSIKYAKRSKVCTTRGSAAPTRSQGLTDVVT